MYLCISVCLLYVCVCCMCVCKHAPVCVRACKHVSTLCVCVCVCECLFTLHYRPHISVLDKHEIELHETSMFTLVY